MGATRFACNYRDLGKRKRVEWINLNDFKGLGGRVLACSRLAYLQHHNADHKTVAPGLSAEGEWGGGGGGEEANIRRKWRRAPVGAALRKSLHSGPIYLIMDFQARNMALCRRPAYRAGKSAITIYSSSIGGYSMSLKEWMGSASKPVEIKSKFGDFKKDYSYPADFEEAFETDGEEECWDLYCQQRIIKFRDFYRTKHEAKILKMMTKNPAKFAAALQAAGIDTSDIDLS